MTPLAFKIGYSEKIIRFLNIRQKLPDHIAMNRGYIYRRLLRITGDLTMLYPNTDTNIELTTARTLLRH